MVMVMVMVIVVVFRKKYTSPRGENSGDITVQGLQGPRSTKVGSCQSITWSQRGTIRRSTCHIMMTPATPTSRVIYTNNDKILDRFNKPENTENLSVPSVFGYELLLQYSLHCPERCQCYRI